MEGCDRVVHCAAALPLYPPEENSGVCPLNLFLYFHDGNKNISELIDADSATLAAHYEYAPFGAVTVATGPFAAVNPYRFSSEYHDAALGCVYYNYRHYNPLDGRWMSRDPRLELGHRTGSILQMMLDRRLRNGRYIRAESFVDYRFCQNSGLDHYDCVGD